MEEQKTAYVYLKNEQKCNFIII